MIRKQAFLFLISGVLWYMAFTVSNATEPASVAAGDEQNTVIPQEYQQIYSRLREILDDFDSRLKLLNSSEKYPVIFGAELLTANCNRGEALLRPQAINGVIAYLDRLQELGVQGVTFPIHYPIYTPEFPRYEEYAAFYKQVAQEVRRRGMKMDIESGVIFANTSFSSLTISYEGLTFEKYMVEKKQMIVNIIKDLKPDYLNLGSEPDTEATLTGLKEFNDPDKYTGYINYILNGLDRGKTKIIAGIGSWGNIEYIKNIAAYTSIDCIDIHVYPIIKRSLSKIFLITNIAHTYHKGLILDEAWLYKSDKYLGNVPENNNLKGNNRLTARVRPRHALNEVPAVPLVSILEPEIS